MGANRKIILVAIALITIAVYSSVSAKEITAGNGSEANFSTIQEAVNNSSPGDVIIVLPGTYNETVDVKVEGLSILSESRKPEDTIVTGFFVYANNVTISRLGMQNTGIYGEDCFNCIFSDNVLFDSSIILRVGNDQTNVTIINNTIKDGSIGLGGSSENTIINNTISNSISDTEDSYGITFYEGHSNYIAENHISSSKYGILMGRLSSNNEIINNTLTSNDRGISVTDVSLSNNITGNTITNNSIGIWEEYAWNNLITDNNVSLNKEYGVYLNKVSYEAPYTGTTLFYNNIFNNTVNVLNDTSSYYTSEAVNNGAGITPVIWNTTKTSGTSITGGPYLGGNFWAKPDGTGISQTCADMDGDGICDLPYGITGNDSDYLPLTSPLQPVPLVANFSANVTSGNAPLKVLFTDKSTGSPTSWLWDFGDSIYSKHAMNATHTFTRPGKYNISLTVANANGSNKTIKPGFITVKSLEAPVANFSANVTSGNAPLKVLFTDKSTGSPTSWLWDFGDGIYSKHAMNATHTFTKPGRYNITLTVSNAAGSNTVKKTGYITVKALKAPVAAFTANVTSGKAPLVVKFTDTGTGGKPASWLWDFGDCIYSKHAMNATHTYTRAGTYDVTLTVKNDAGSNTTKKTGYITVQNR
jgi:parallel beta-helix repeat protein